MLKAICQRLSVQRENHTGQGPTKKFLQGKHKVVVQINGQVLYYMVLKLNLLVYIPKIFFFINGTTIDSVDSCKLELNIINRGK